MQRMPATQSPRSTSPRLGPREPSPRASSPARGSDRTPHRPPFSTGVGSKPRAAPIKVQAKPLPYEVAEPFVAAPATPPTSATLSLSGPGASPQLRPAEAGQLSPSRPSAGPSARPATAPSAPTERRGYTSATSAISRYAVASPPTALPNGMAEPETLKQALSVVRLLTAQLHEARGDKSVIWEQTRADARAMAQVARNIEGSQGVVSSAIQSLEQQLEGTRQEREREREAARGDKKLFERLQREQERMLREAEKARDKALAAAAEAGVARQKAQEQLEVARRTESDALRTAHAERAALAREVRQLQERLQREVRGDAPPPAQLAELAAGVSSLRAMLGAEAEGGGASGGERLVAAARAQRDEAEGRLETLRSAMQVAGCHPLAAASPFCGSHAARAALAAPRRPSPPWTLLPPLRAAGAARRTHARARGHSRRPGGAAGAALTRAAGCGSPAGCGGA